MSSAASWSTGRSIGPATPRSPGSRAAPRTTTCDGCPVTEVPASEEQFHRRVYYHHWNGSRRCARVRRGPGRDELLRRAREQGRTLADRQRRRGHRSAQRSVAADLTTCPGRSAAPSRIGRGRRPNGDRGRHRDVLYVFTIATPRGGCASRVRAARTTPGSISCPRIRRRCSMVTRSWTDLPSTRWNAALLLVAWTRHAVSELDPRPGRRHSPRKRRPAGLPAASPGLSSDPRAVRRHGSASRRLRHAVIGLPLRRRDRRDPDSGRPRPDRWTCPRTTRQVTYTSYDGTPVRMFVTSQDGHASPRPTILYGYGGFGVSLTPAYAASILAWVEASGVYAVANLRGGSEEGEEWHRAGMRDRKQNVFDDFRAAAEELVRSTWTEPGRLAISGGSNGGLLVGAALTSGPTCTPPWPAPRRCSTWCGTSVSGSGVPGTTSTAPQTMRASSSGSCRTRRPPRGGRHALSGGAVHGVRQ